MDINIENILEVELKDLTSNEFIKISRKYDFHLLDIQGIESADMEISTNSNITYDGSVVTNRRIRHRNIVLEVEYLGNDKLGAREKVIKLFNVHNKSQFSIRYGNNRKKIHFFTESLNAPIVNVHRPFRFRISMICPSPYFFDYNDRTVHLVEWMKNLTFPLKIPNKRGLVFGKKKNRSYVNVRNRGHVKTGMTITISSTGDVINPFIMNSQTREFIKIEKHITPGEIFIITTDDGNKGVEMINDPEGRNNGYRFVTEDSTFLQLAIGDNLIRYGADEGLNNLSVFIQYNDKYLGV